MIETLIGLAFTLFAMWLVTALLNRICEYGTDEHASIHEDTQTQIKKRHYHEII